MSSSIYYKKSVNKYYQKLKYSIIDLKYKKYFLICGTCFWMASTLPVLKEINMIQYKKCPICVNDVYRFLICDDSFY